MSKYLVAYSYATRVYKANAEFTVTQTQYWNTFETLGLARKFYKSLSTGSATISSAGITKLVEGIGYLGE